jgi:hypothetical protein
MVCYPSTRNPLLSSVKGLHEGQSQRTLHIATGQLEGHSKSRVLQVQRPTLDHHLVSRMQIGGHACQATVSGFGTRVACSI